MDERFQFTFTRLREHFAQAVENDYRVVSCADYVDLKKRGLNGKTLVNRVDIDVSCTKARRVAEIFDELGIRGTFFVRLHAPEYNPFSFENHRCLLAIRDSGHEIGYHSEVIDEAAIWQTDPEECLRRDLRVLAAMLDIDVVGVASHGGLTGLNNLDFWKTRKPSEYGLLYEAYDEEPEFDLFRDSLYVTDSSWTHWKCYENGALKDEPSKPLGEHFGDGHPLIYSLIHPESYYDAHFYE